MNVLLKYYALILGNCHEFQPSLGSVVFVFSTTQLKWSIKAIMWIVFHIIFFNMQVMMINMFAYSLTNRTSFPTLLLCPTFVKFWTLFYAFDICVAFFSHYAGSILIDKFVFPSKNLVFNSFFSIFSHLFTMFLNPIVEISLSSCSNSLSKVAHNFSKEFGAWPSHDRTLASSIWGINVFTASSQIFLPSQHPAISPPTFILILWGFLPITYYTWLIKSFSFFTTLRVALATLFDFTNGIGAYCIGGVVIDVNFFPSAIPHCVNSHCGVCKSCCIHLGGGCHFHCLEIGFGGSIEEELFRVFGARAKPSWSKVCNNFLFLSICVASEPTTMPTTLFFDSTSSWNHTTCKK